MPRAHAKVLYGDLMLTEHLINTTSHKYKSGYLSFSHKLSKEAIKRRLLLDWQNNSIAMNLRKVLDRLEQRGLKVNQGNSEKLTDKNGKPIGVRLKVSMFKKGFDCLRFQSYNKKCEHSVYDHRTSRNKRKQLNGRLLATGIKIKEV